MTGMESQVPSTPSPAVWPGALVSPEALNEHIIETGHALADAAAAGDWARLFQLLDTNARPVGIHEYGGVNAWRPGGTAWFTPLHQAAWHGAPVDVVTELLGRGAWRTLPDARGRTAHQVAQERGHEHLLEALAPAPVRRVDDQVLPVLDRHLHALADAQIRPQLTVRMRYPVTRVLTELPEQTILWWSVPGMYGGFSVELRNSYLFVTASSRMGGGARSHVVTTEGAVLVEEKYF